VGGRSNKSTHCKPKEASRVGEIRCGERLKETKKGLRLSQDRLEKGPRAAIGKKRADGQKCSHVSLLLGRGPIEAAEQLLVKVDMRFCCRGGLGEQEGDGKETRW
jgi:hypothetical protein